METCSNDEQLKLLTRPFIESVGSDLFVDRRIFGRTLPVSSTVYSNYVKSFRKNSYGILPPLDISKGKPVHYHLGTSSQYMSADLLYGPVSSECVHQIAEDRACLKGEAGPPLLVQGHQMSATTLLVNCLETLRTSLTGILLCQSAIQNGRLYVSLFNPNLFSPRMYYHHFDQVRLFMKIKGFCKFSSNLTKEVQKKRITLGRVCCLGVEIFFLMHTTGLIGRSYSLFEHMFTFCFRTLLSDRELYMESSGFYNRSSTNLMTLSFEHLEYVYRERFSSEFSQHARYLKRLTPTFRAFRRGISPLIPFLTHLFPETKVFDGIPSVKSTCVVAGVHDSTATVYLLEPLQLDFAYIDCPGFFPYCVNVSMEDLKKSASSWYVHRKMQLRKDYLGEGYQEGSGVCSGSKRKRASSPSSSPSFEDVIEKELRDPVVCMDDRRELSHSVLFDNLVKCAVLVEIYGVDKCKQLESRFRSLVHSEHLDVASISQFCALVNLFHKHLESVLHDRSLVLQIRKLLVGCMNAVVVHAGLLSQNYYHIFAKLGCSDDRLGLIPPLSDYGDEEKWETRVNHILGTTSVYPLGSKLNDDKHNSSWFLLYLKENALTHESLLTMLPRDFVSIPVPSPLLAFSDDSPLPIHVQQSLTYRSRTYSGEDSESSSSYSNSPSLFELAQNRVLRVGNSSPGEFQAHTEDLYFFLMSVGKEQCVNSSIVKYLLSSPSSKFVMEGECSRFCDRSSKGECTICLEPREVFLCYKCGNGMCEDCVSEMNAIHLRRGTYKNGLFAYTYPCERHSFSFHIVCGCCRTVLMEHR